MPKISTEKYWDAQILTLRKCIEFSCAVGWGSDSLSQIDTSNRNKGGLCYTRIEAAIPEMEAFNITQDNEVQTEVISFWVTQ